MHLGQQGTSCHSPLEAAAGTASDALADADCTSAVAVAGAFHSDLHTVAAAAYTEVVGEGCDAR